MSKARKEMEMVVLPPTAEPGPPLKAAGGCLNSDEILRPQHRKGEMPGVSYFEWWCRQGTDVPVTSRGVSE